MRLYLSLFILSFSSSCPDGGHFNTFVRGALQVAETGSWVAVSCHEAMVETASATRALSLCETVVGLARKLRKMPRVVSEAEEEGCMYPVLEFKCFVLCCFVACAVRCGVSI